MMGRSCNAASRACWCVSATPWHTRTALRRAVLTGLGILSHLNVVCKQFRDDYRIELKPWIGVHTGSAVVETKEDGISLAGEARNVSVRLDEVAVPGKVICSEATYRLIQGEFQCTNLGPRKIKGVAQPVELFQVQEAHQTRSPIEVAELATLTPLTGRDHEISLLKDRWEQAQEGMGQVVLLTGEPGLGKSRLVHALKEHVLGQAIEGEIDAPVIEWRCSPHFQNTSLYPAIDFYERASDSGVRSSPRPGSIGYFATSSSMIWPARKLYRSGHRCCPCRSQPTFPQWRCRRSGREKKHFGRSWNGSACAARRPILFIIEDLHWMDASTLEFVGQFLGEGMHDRVLTVLTFRPEFQTPWPALPIRPAWR